jgi:hypothetical protein
MEPPIIEPMPPSTEPNSRTKIAPPASCYDESGCCLLAQDDDLFVGASHPEVGLRDGSPAL